LVDSGDVGNPLNIISSANLAGLTSAVKRRDAIAALDKGISDLTLNQETGQTKLNQGQTMEQAPPPPIVQPADQGIDISYGPRPTDQGIDISPRPTDQGIDISPRPTDQGIDISPRPTDQGSGQTMDQAPPPPIVQPAGATSGISSVTEAGAGFTTVTKADGTVVKREGVRSWRNNNPGNLEAGDFATSKGAIGSDGRFAVFRTYEEGREAMRSLLFEGKNYRTKTISEAITRYAPPKENDTALYIKRVTDALGVSDSTKLSDLSNDQRSTMLDAMQKHEGFKEGTETVVEPMRLPPVRGSEQNNLPPSNPRLAAAQLRQQRKDQDSIALNSESLAQLDPSTAESIINLGAPVAGLVLRQLPWANVQAFGQYLSKGKIDIKDVPFNKGDVELIKEKVSEALAKGKNRLDYPDWGVTGKGVLVGGLLGTAQKSVTDPNFRMATFLGQVGIRKAPNGDIILVDKYDFNPGPKGDKLKEALLARETGDAATYEKLKEEVLGGLSWLEATRVWAATLKISDEPAEEFTINLGKLD
jgi:hypothetical protein